MQAGGGRDSGRRRVVPLVLAAGVGVDVGLAEHDGHGLGAGRAERHEHAVEGLTDQRAPGAAAGTRRRRGVAVRPRAAARRWAPAPSRGSGPRAGRATAPATAVPSMARATCTAQSDRPRSLNSRVPSRGSTIHTRCVSRRARSSRPSSESNASSGRSRWKMLDEQEVGLAVAGVAHVFGPRVLALHVPSDLEEQVPGLGRGPRRQLVVASGGEGGGHADCLPVWSGFTLIGPCPPRTS